MQVALALLLAAAASAGLGSARRLEEPGYTTAYLSLLVSGSPPRRERSEVAKYGDAHVSEASGTLVRARSGSGDDRGCDLPLAPSFPPGPWIALVRRGHCDFRTKVDNAFRSRASAVIVFDDRESATLDYMRLMPDDGKNISAVFTYKWKGEELSRLLDNGTRILVNITIANRFSRSYTSVNKTSVLFVSVSFIILMVISLAWLVFYYVQRFRYIHAKDRLSRRLCSAAKKALSKIPTKHLKSEDKEIEEGECCAICIEPFKISEVLRILPCKHEFHKICIDPWLLEHRTCPMCKMDILKYYGFFFTGSQESILDMDTEETVSESESLQQRNSSPIPQITSSEIQVSTHLEDEIEPASEEETSASEDSNDYSTCKNSDENLPSQPVYSEEPTPKSDVSDEEEPQDADLNESS